MRRSPLILATLALSLLLGGCGSRSIGNKIDDQFVGPNVASAVAKANTELNSPNSHIVVTSYNGVILLAGQTPSEALKNLAGQTAQKVEGVRKVHNELQIQQPSSLLARSNDSLLTTNIKTQMLASTGVPSTSIKVVTENGIVYLMGIVSHQEANAASNLVQSVSGVQKIVRLFQYTD